MSSILTVWLVPLLCLLLHAGGELHFLQIGGVCDDVDDGDMFIDGPLFKGADLLLEGAKPPSNPSSPGISGKTANNTLENTLAEIYPTSNCVVLFSCLAFVQEWTSWWTNRWPQRTWCLWWKWRDSRHWPPAFRPLCRPAGWRCSRSSSSDATHSTFTSSTMETQPSTPEPGSCRVKGSCLQSVLSVTSGLSCHDLRMLSHLSLLFFFSPWSKSLYKFVSL